MTRMKEQERYRQPPLPLDGAQRSQGGHDHGQPAPPGGTERRDEASVMPSIADDPQGLPRGLASHRLPGDFWPEFHLEWAFREEHGMTPVSPAEFADMRDQSDGLIEPEDTVWLREPAPSSYARETTE